MTDEVLRACADQRISSALMSLVVRGAGTRRPCFPIPLSIRACGFPAHGLPMVFLTWLRGPWIADGASEPVQAPLVEPALSPLVGLSGMQVAAPLLHKQAPQPAHHIAVDLTELRGGVPGAEVVSPTAQDRVQVLDQPFDWNACTVATGAVPDFPTKPLHRPLRGPPVQVVAHDAFLFPQPTRHAGMEVTSKKVETLPAFPKINDPRLIRMQLQPQPGHNLPGLLQGHLRAGKCPAHDH